ncbi:hypothetical protein [Candidatus Tisiphia endosymbiont of Nemotelus uliginosus]|uniref:hypothetical protein n=1 Tax=Candidatus Tisiphia endosymbiont of Nemotelus uliginosus TaxID=3077926 RepID=UPI0035C8C081
MSKTHNETNPQNDSVDSGSITLKIGGLINRLKLFKEVGDITIVNTPLNKSDYSTALKEYDNLNTTAKKTTQFPSSADKAEFLFDLNKCQAVIAVRAGQDASTYLKAWQSANSNDFMTGLQTILEERIKFLQETGDITKINKPLDSSEYKSSKSIYDALVKIMKKYPLSDDIRAKLSFDLNKCQAISAVRAGKPADQDASTYLEAWEKSANADDFMTGLQTILEERIKFLQETGDITKINNPLDSSEYQSSKSIYDSLVKTIKDYSLSDEIKTKLSFDLNKCQAISAVRAGKPADQDASTYLKACGSISANRNDFIIELYKIINLQKKVANNVQNPELKITTQLYKPLLEQAFEVVGSFLNSNNYEAALDEITPLIKYANTVLTLEKYVEICIKEAAPQKLEECWNQCLMTTSSTIEKSKTLAGIFQKLHDTFESLASVDPKTKAKYEDIAKQANERAIQYTPQKEEVQVSQEKPTVSVSKKEEKALKELKALEKAQVTLGTKLINTKAKVEVIRVETLFDAEAEAEKAKLRDKLKAEEAELMARLEAKKNKQKLDIEVEKSTQLSEIRGQGSSTKDTLVTPTAPPKEVEASDSSNVAETSDSSNKSVSKGIYPSISAFKAELADDNVAAAKASSSINVYNNSPYSYTAGTHQTAPIKAVMPTSRSADPTDAAEIAADKEAAEIAAAKEAAEIAAAKEAAEIAAAKEAAEIAAAKEAAEIAAAKEAAEIAAAKEAAEIAAAKEAAEIAAAKEAAEVLKTTLLKNVKEFITSSKTDTMKQIIVDCDNAIKKGINVYETVNDVKTLEVLASGFLSLNNQEKAEEICGKIAGISQDAYKFIGNNKILSLLAKKYSEIELYKSCIESCKKLYQTSEENYQLLKAIVEKTTDTDIQLDALTVAKSQTDNRKQQAELFLSKGKILLSLGKKEQASHEFGEAGVYDHDIYKNIDKETLKSLYESGNPEVGYWYLSKTHNFNHKDPSLAKKLVEFSSYLNSVHGISGEAACLIKAYLCAPNADTLVQVENDLSIMKSKPYAADYYKNCCAINNNPAQMETYLQGIVQVIDEHM